MKTQNTQQQNSIASEHKHTQANPLNELTGIQRDLLRELIALGEASGADVRETIEASYGREISHPTVYKNLDALSNTGLVEKGQYERDGRTNSYALTDEGERAFGAHLRYMCSTATSTGGDA